MEHTEVSGVGVGKGVSTVAATQRSKGELGSGSLDVARGWARSEVSP
jgi:hypothetical protein